MVKKEVTITQLCVKINNMQIGYIFNNIDNAARSENTRELKMSIEEGKTKLQKVSD